VECHPRTSGQLSRKSRYVMFSAVQCSEVKCSAVCILTAPVYPKHSLLYSVCIYCVSHPIELSDETLSQSSERLGTYSISQQCVQLVSRRCNAVWDPWALNSGREAIARHS
jgi:hypothetical protein